MNLSLPVFLDITIGLTLIYLILSLLASEIQELVAWFFRSRAYRLKKSIQILVGGTGNLKDEAQTLQSEDQKANFVTNKLYENSLIASLYQPIFLKSKKNNYGPSYIDAETFATALVEVIQPYLKKVIKVSETPTRTDELLSFSTASQDDIKLTMEDLSEFPEKLKVYLSELALRAKAKADASKKQLTIYQFQQEIQAWFERSQKRTSGAYKRIAKVRLFLIGLVAAGLANADTFHIVNSLYNQPKVRQAVTQVAVRAADSCKAPTTTTSPTTTPSCEDTINAALALDELPMGWKNAPQFTVLPGIDDLMRIGGWIVSAVAVTMGATFWFDLLKNLVNVRNAGPKPASSSDNQATSQAQKAST